MLPDMRERRKQINFRTDDQLQANINWLRRRTGGAPPSIREVVRQAIAEKVEREREAKRAARR